ncbi:MAG: hypothetical protein KGJ84_04975 [Elusimicrobia bacterium]|nr:hypothetical protein [Elusimicrobiota bacterium]
MTEYGKAQIQALGAGLVGFVVVVGAGALLMFPHGKASVKAPASSYAPVDVTSSLSAPVPVSKSALSGASQSEAAPVASSPAPLLPAEDREDAPAPAAVPATAPAPAAAAHPQARATPVKKLSVTRHLDGSSSANSSAVASAASAPAKKPAPPAHKPMLSPKLDLSKATQGSLASSIHYGVNDRSELMGRAAGPVYNFAGRNVNPQVTPSAGGPTGVGMEQVDAAQKQIDESNLSDADKAAIDATIGKVRQAGQSAQ